MQAARTVTQGTIIARPSALPGALLIAGAKGADFGGLLARCEHGLPALGGTCVACARAAVVKRGKRVAPRCPHNRERAFCKHCLGSAYCDHLVQRKTCFVCKGTEICKHDKNRAYCAECGGRLLCRVCRKRRVYQIKVCRWCREAESAVNGSETVGSNGLETAGLNGSETDAAPNLKSPI